MCPGYKNGSAGHTAEVAVADEQSDFRLSEILRLRGSPFLMLLNANGKPEYTSNPAHETLQDPLIVEQATKEAMRLFLTEESDVDVTGQLRIDKDEERCALVMLDHACYTIRIVSLLKIEGKRAMPKRYVALVEPIVGASTEGIEFDRVQKTWRLSKRETDVLRTLMSGATDKHIANTMDVSVETVRAYLKSIRAKLGVGTRTAIVHAVHGLNSVCHREDVTSRLG